MTGRREVDTRCLRTHSGGIIPFRGRVATWIANLLYQIHREGVKVSELWNGGKRRQVPGCVSGPQLWCSQAYDRRPSETNEMKANRESGPDRHIDNPPCRLEHRVLLKPDLSFDAPKYHLNEHFIDSNGGPVGLTAVSRSSAGSRHN